MRKGGSKAKGSEFERTICKALSLWMSRNVQDDLFWRSAMSGGRATVQFNRGAKNRTQTGDISAIHPHGERLTKLFVIDTKFYKDLHILSMLEGDCAGATLAVFWCRLKEEAWRSRKLPMLIVKQNFRPPLILLDEDGAELLMPGGKMPIHNTTYFGAHRAYMMDFGVFLAHARRP